MAFDFHDEDDYTLDIQGSDDDSSNASNDSADISWNTVIVTSKRFTATECQAILLDLRYTWSSNFCYARATKYVQLIERFYETADTGILAMFSRSVEYSLAALIMDGLLFLHYLHN